MCSPIAGQKSLSGAAERHPATSEVDGGGVSVISQHSTLTKSPLRLSLADAAISGVSTLGR
jgi:hypothetical protein